MTYIWFKFPIFWILLWKVSQISGTRQKLKESKKWTPEDETKLVIFMVLYCMTFVLLLLS